MRQMSHVLFAGAAIIAAGSSIPVGNARCGVPLPLPGPPIRATDQPQEIADLIRGVGRPPDRRQRYASAGVPYPTSARASGQSVSHRQSALELRPGPERSITNSIGMRLVLIPAGRFVMGSPESEREREPEETPHPILITKPFYLGVFEVTQDEYAKVRRENQSFFKEANGGGPTHPVENVIHREAVSFCERLSALPEEQAAGRRYRLPTEAEWEYACRAGTRAAFHFGNTLASRQANFNGNYPFGSGEKGQHLRKTAPVGSYPPNSFGLHDMHGNVWEWCSDWYDPEYYRKSPEADPKGPPAGVLRTGFRDDSTDPGDTGFYLVGRGGCWLDEARGCRSAYRFRFMPNDRYRLVGFRVACSVSGPAS